MIVPRKILLILGIVLFLLSGISGQTNLYYLKTKSGEEYRQMKVVPMEDQKYIKIENPISKDKLILLRSEVTEITHESSFVGNDYHNYRELKPEEKKLAVKPRSGYVGVLMGLAMPLGSFGERGQGNARTGFQFKVVHFGYIFNKTFGVGVNYLTGFHQLKVRGFEPWRHQGLFSGPIINLPITYRSTFEIKPMIGLSQTSLSDGTASIATFNAAFLMNMLIKINMGPKTCLHIGGSLFYSNPEFDQVNLAVPIRVLSADVGIALRIF